ncbi:MAG: DUF86 domain-containing protein [Candidatus Nanopelagicaceae bacterium]|nr:DUF86 domain-containing protein [Candidatus Nanopelagicaceae bacterium]
MSPRDDVTRLGDILERISRIESAEIMLVKAESNQDWDVAKTAFDAILYDLLVIGEVVKILDERIKLAYAGIPWKEITGMRDILAHEYFRVSSSIVRSTIDLPLADLRAACDTELKK